MIQEVKKNSKAFLACVVAALLVGAAMVTAYAMPMQNAYAAMFGTAENPLEKRSISDYDASMTLVTYEEIQPTPEQIEMIKSATQLQSNPATPSFTYQSGAVTGDIGIPASLAGAVTPGYFSFTTYGWGHCVGMSQNGANHYATYGGYSYQQILSHYFPGTTLVQDDPNGYITACGVTGTIVDIVSQLVFNEMSSTMHPEAMKAQAIAAYTYIKFNGGYADNVILKPNPPQNVVDAVKEVAGLALYYNGSYALTVYTASSGGMTANSEEIWGRSYPYLVNVPCEYDALYDPHYGEVKTYTMDEVRYKIQAAYGIYLSDNPANWIQPVYGAAGYVTEVNIDGQKVVDGYQFSNFMDLRSSRFAVVCG